jgi:hypothetical protein
MQLEHLGLNCSNWNNTGPTQKDDPGCMAIDPAQDWCACRRAAPRRQALGPLMRGAVRARALSCRCYCHAAVAAGATIPPSGMLDIFSRPQGDGPGLCTSVVRAHARCVPFDSACPHGRRPLNALRAHAPLPRRWRRMRTARCSTGGTSTGTSRPRCARCSPTSTSSAAARRSSAVRAPSASPA